VPRLVPLFTYIVCRLSVTRAERSKVRITARARDFSLLHNKTCSGAYTAVSPGVKRTARETNRPYPVPSLTVSAAVLQLAI
jgi:hypothetical protein